LVSARRQSRRSFRADYRLTCGSNSTLLGGRGTQRRLALSFWLAVCLRQLVQCCIMSMVSGSDELAMISSQYGWLTLTGGPIGCADCASANDGKDSNNSNAASDLIVILLPARQRRLAGKELFCKERRDGQILPRANQLCCVTIHPLKELDYLTIGQMVRKNGAYDDYDEIGSRSTIAELATLNFPTFPSKSSSWS
jgi:hypothetical protein